LAGWTATWDVDLSEFFWLVSCGAGRRRVLSAGEVGAPDPDHADHGQQREHRDPGGHLEPTGDPGGQRLV
jgi:hypothetical protein